MPVSYQRPAALLYYLVRPVARYVLRYYYRRIDLSGLEHIPPDGAVILAANHPTAFIEPCLLACFQARTLHFLARGDLFGKWWQNALLAAVNILPVYRLKDGGYSKLRNNFDTFDACYDSLARGRAIMIMAEGNCVHEKRLRPLRKGTARLALGALARHPDLKEVYVVPVGVNFTAAADVRSEVFIRCGEAIRATEFLAAGREVSPTALKNFTSHLRARLSKLVTQIPDRERDALGEARLKTLAAKLEPTPVYGLTRNAEISGKQHRVAAETPTTDDGNIVYHNRLEHNNLEATNAGAMQDTKAGLASVLSSLAILLQLPQLPLWILAEALASALPKTVEFYSPVRFAVVAGGSFLLYPVGLIALPWPGKIWLLASLLSVRWSIRNWETLRRWWQARRWKRLVTEEREILVAMRERAEAGLGE